MNTTLYRSLALLISMFALTSSFSLSTHIHDNVSDTKEVEIISSTINEEDAWIVDVVESKDTGSSIRYTVKGNDKQENKQKSIAFFDEVMKYQVMRYQNMGELISKELNGKFDSIFRVSRSNYKNVTVGVISKNCMLHLFSAVYSIPSVFSYQKCLLDKIHNTFFAKEMEEDTSGALKLYFNGQGKKIIEVRTAKFSNEKTIGSFVSRLDVEDSNNKKKDDNSNNNSGYMNYPILFWGSIFAFAAIYAIYKYWWLPRKKSL